MNGSKELFENINLFASVLKLLRFGSLSLNCWLIYQKIYHFLFCSSLLMITRFGEGFRLRCEFFALQEFFANLLSNYSFYIILNQTNINCIQYNSLPYILFSSDYTILELKSVWIVMRLILVYLITIYLFFVFKHILGVNARPLNERRLCVCIVWKK